MRDEAAEEASQLGRIPYNLHVSKTGAHRRNRAVFPAQKQDATAVVSSVRTAHGLRLLLSGEESKTEDALNVIQTTHEALNY